MRAKWHLLLLLFISAAVVKSPIAVRVVAQNGVVEVNIGVILDFHSMVGKGSNVSISVALSDFYETHDNYTTRLLLHRRDSQKDNIAAASAALDLLRNKEVIAIVGPQTSEEAKFVAELGTKAQVPVLSFSATNPSLSSTPPGYFIRTTNNDSTQVKAIASIVQAFGWREVVLIYEDTAYGTGVIPYLTDALQQVDALVPFRTLLPLSSTNEEIGEELYKLMNMQTRVFIVHMTTSLAARLFSRAKEVGMMSQEYAWIITDGITNLLDTMESSVIDSMQGVLGVKPYVLETQDLENFKVRWKRTLWLENPEMEKIELSSFGLWAYDTVWALAMAVEQVFGYTKVDFNWSSIPKGDLIDVRVSKIGPALLDAILEMSFNGLSGRFQLVNGQLPSSIFEIVNVVGKGGRGIGFWTPVTGISLSLNGKNKTHSSSRDNMKPIIWPGESMVVPRGWVIPTVGKKLRVGVPVKDGFREFLKVERDPFTNETMVSGFCIDVFVAVMEALPYAVPYEFIPFENASGKSAGSYDDLVYQVYLQNYDAVVGDISIISNRSKIVDFTLPYTESGIRMIVPVKDDQSKNAWVFLKPLSKELWMMTAAFFVFTGFAVWILEHRINPDFRGPPHQQLGVIFYFSFSTMVFAHKEAVANNLTRFMVVIWVFVVWILTSSYTASLTSMLTVQQLRPTVTNIDSLLKNGDYVGYQKDSFVRGLLKHIGFKESKMIEYASLEEFEQGLSKGSQNGGVAAIFDGIPCLTLFLSKYCNNYTMEGPTFKNAGYGFVFPKGSTLVSDVSQAVLTITEGDKMEAIKQAWFGHQTTCLDSSTTVTSGSLGLQSFWGLFLITGAATLTVLLIYLVSFLYEGRHILKTSNSSPSEKMVSLARRFDERDSSSQAFKTFNIASSNSSLSH